MPRSTRRAPRLASDRRAFGINGCTALADALIFLHRKGAFLRATFSYCVYFYLAFPPLCEATSCPVRKVQGLCNLTVLNWLVRARNKPEKQNKPLTLEKKTNKKQNRTEGHSLSGTRNPQ